MKKLLLLLPIIVPTLLCAQVVPHVKYTSKDGLIADRITSITQDAQGMMWFGSYYGMCRYNGQTFENILLPQHQQQKFVSSIIPLKHSVVAGFYFRGGFTEYLKGKAISINSEVNDRDISMIASAKNSVLIVAYQQIYRYSHGVCKLLIDFSKFKTASHSINDLVEVDDETIWVGSGSGLFVFKKQQNVYELAQTSFTNQPIINLYKDPKNRIWVMAGGANVSIAIAFAQKGSKDLKTIFKNNNILAIPYESNTATSFWGLDAIKGLFRLSAEGQVLYYPLIVDKGSFTSVIFCDRENNVWIANDPGVIKLSLHNTRNYFFDELAAAGGFVSILKNGSLLVSNSKKLYLINKGKIKKLPEFRRNTDAGYIGSFIEAGKDQLWIYRWEYGLWKATLQNNGLVEKRFLATYKDQPISLAAFLKKDDQTLWAAGLRNLYQLSGEKIRNQVPVEAITGLPVQVTCMAIDRKRNRIFIGGNTNGIFQVKYKATDRDIISYRLEKHYTAKDGLGDEYIRSLLYDAKGFLWAGTRYGGIYQIAVNKTPVTLKNFNSNNGISCTRIMGIAEEAGTSVWFATCNGVHRFFYNGHWQHYDMSSGLPASECYSIALDTAKKIAWAVTAEGVSAIDYAARLEKAPPPIINFTAIDVLGQPDSAAMHAAGRIKYPSEKNSLSFHFSGSSFIDEKKVKYKYILEGYSRRWSEPTVTNNVTYASLPAGQYTFKVVASNAQGTWSDKPAQFAFEIVLPFYKKTWFYFLLFSMVLLMFYLAQNYRLRQKIKLEKLRFSIARDLHDDIGSALGSINILSKTATRKLQKTTTKEEIIGTFKKIGTSAQSTLDSMDDIIWAINPQKDNWGDLLLRMKEFAIPLCEAVNIQLVMNVHAEDYHKLPMQLRRNIFLIFKESFNNALRHSKCQSIVVDSFISHGTFHLKIKDDGTGFNVDKETNRNGLKNLQHRAALVNGTIKITSAHIKGTSLHFHCPIR